MLIYYIISEPHIHIFKRGVGIRNTYSFYYVLLYRQLFLKYPCGFNNYDINNEK